MKEAWRVGVTIAMNATGMGMLGEIARALGLARTVAQGLESDLKRVRIAALGTVEAFAGFRALNGIRDMIGNFDLNREKTKFSLGDPQELARAQQLAIATQSAVPTTTYAENMKAINELSGQLGSVDEVAKVLPDVMKLAQVISVSSGASMDDSVVKATKFADLSGQLMAQGPDGKEHVDAGKFAAAMETVERMSIASRGLLGPSDLLNFAKQAGVPIRMMDDKAIAAMGEAIIAMGGSRAGTAETSLFSQMAGGKVSQAVAAEMTRAGLLKVGDYDVRRGGAVVLHPDATKRLGEAATDPEKLAADIADRLRAQGASRNDIMRELFRLFGRQTTMRLVAEMIQGAPQIERFKENYEKAQGPQEAYQTIMRNDATANVQAFTAAWNSLMQALGDAAAPVWIPILRGITSFIQGLGEAISAHPGIAAAVLALGSAIAGIVFLHGTIMVATITLGLLSKSLGMAGLSGALTTFAEGMPAAQAMLGLVGLIGKLGAAAIAAHATLSAIDPQDKTGAWIDRNIPGAAWLDNTAATHLGIGRTYAEQAQANGVAPTPADTQRTNSGNGPVPVHVVNGRDLQEGMTNHLVDQVAQPSGGTTNPDLRLTPMYPGSGWMP